MTIKELWKQYYRILRIARRESLLAHNDMMTFGTGCLKIGGDPLELKCLKPEVWRR